MTHRDRVADFIRRFPGRDDDEISSALNIKPRQTINQICRALEKAGAIERRSNTAGKLGNFPLAVRSSFAGATVRKPSANSAPVSDQDVTGDWFWEGNVTDALAKYLRSEGWAVVSQADTRSRERGVDLHVAKDGREMVIEVKGYPSSSYRDPARAGQPKATAPSSQAQQWYSHALLKVLRLQTSHPACVAAMAFPDFPRFRSLFRETKKGLARLGIVVFFVSQSGSVETG
jgi:hypothetical protein